MGPLEEMALKRDVGILIQQSQVRRALGALLRRVEGAAEREPVHPSIGLQPRGCPSAECGEIVLGRLGQALPVLWEGGAAVS